MRHALNLPIMNEFSNPRLLSNLAQEAEAAGWDGVFVWDILLFDPQSMPAVTDPWIALAAIAMCTNSIKIGPMVATLARRRPWKVAREVVALDHLSGGRMVLGVGLGQSGSGDFAQFGETSDPKVRATRLDEALDIVAGLCSGEPFSYQGQHFQIQETVFRPQPVQAQIPIWVAGWWPNKAPMRRAARWDGAYPAEVHGTDSSFEIIPTSPKTVREILSFITEHRSKTTPFDMVISRSLWDEDPGAARELVAEFSEAGATWIIQDVLPWEVSPGQARELIRRGPPGKQ
jgi:alkanesulfonate monooxygenase SsuD/methylene tetrahydromethanopterin reductase-like flavin-dependent oxidoreductase (luciferase family)